MSNELREKLASELLEDAPWDALALHHERESLLCVRGVALEDVGVALVSDDATAVRTWLESGALARPTALEISDWTSASRSFPALIVQPWVLIAVAPDA